ncbi:MAG: hypothetical protein P4L22_01190 [Candidatus Babeliales bacterium]|nr:hypothetical protein [Candidatus Babeliales bacterium]
MLSKIILSILFISSAHNLNCADTAQNETMSELHQFFKESKEGNYNFYKFFKKIKPLIDKEVVSELIFLYTSSDINNSKSAAFFLGLCDYYGITVECNFPNAYRFFKYALNGNENTYISNWISLYLLTLKISNSEEVELCKNIDTKVLSESEKILFKESIEVVGLGLGISLYDIF